MIYAAGNNGNGHFHPACAKSPYKLAPRERCHLPDSPDIPDHPDIPETKVILIEASLSEESSTKIFP